MSAFADRLRATLITADSPDRSVRIQARGDGELHVRVDDAKLRHHTDTTLGEQVEAAIAQLLRANRRTYVQAWRETSQYPNDDPNADTDGH